MTRKGERHHPWYGGAIRDAYREAGIGVRTDGEVARMLGVTVDAACAMRRRLGIPAVPMETRRRATEAGSAARLERAAEKWAAADWTQDNRDIARALGVSVQLVASRRCKLRRAGIDIPRAPYAARRGR